jgi:hypothetical protein
MGHFSGWQAIGQLERVYMPLLYHAGIPVAKLLLSEGRKQKGRGAL